MFNLEHKEKKFGELEKRIFACKACELGKMAHKRVVGSGTKNARIMFLGEAPGANEDKTGKPFMGAAGKRLDTLLACANLKREDIYIANILKCRPPKNRNPRSQEIAACKVFLDEQIKLISPVVVVCMGNFATQFLIGKDAQISKVHGQFIEWGKHLIFPVFHPAAAIYDPKKQVALKKDFAHLREYLRRKEVA